MPAYINMEAISLALHHFPIFSRFALRSTEERGREFGFLFRTPLELCLGSV